MRGFAGIPDTVGDRVQQLTPRELAARHRGRPGAERIGISIPARRVLTADRLLYFGAIESCQPFGVEVEHRGFALRREIAAESSGDIDRAQRRAGDVGKKGRGMGIGRFLENQIVAFESKRVAGELERDVVVTAK